ncbi:MAG: hypothetical protein ACYDBV_15115 [Nitrospiria bacterium]
MRKNNIFISFVCLFFVGCATKQPTTVDRTVLMGEKTQNGKNTTLESTHKMCTEPPPNYSENVKNQIG